MYMYVCMYDCSPLPPPHVEVWIRHCINEGGIGIQDNTSGMWIWECEWMCNKMQVLCKCGLALHVLHMLLSSSTYCILLSPRNNTILMFLSVVFFRNVHFQIIPVR